MRAGSPARTAFAAAASLAAYLSAVLSGGALAHDDLRGLDTVTPDEITVVRRSDGIVFADAGGLTLYVFDEDKPGESTCYRERHCERRWPPLPASGRGNEVGEWTVTERLDGTLQWAYRGSPVYTSSEDRTPGVMSGDNARQTWHALFQPYASPEPVMPPGLAVARVGTDWVFTGEQGRLLYFRTVDGEGDVGCTGDCLYEWTPLMAPALARTIGSWTIRMRQDGSRQWTYDGKPAYYRTHPVMDVADTSQDPTGWSRLLVVENGSAGTGAAPIGGK